METPTTTQQNNVNQHTGWAKNESHQSDFFKTVIKLKEFAAPRTTVVSE